MPSSATTTAQDNRNRGGRSGGGGGANTNQSRSFLQRWMELLATILRLLFWPILHVNSLLFPVGEYDGLSPAVTEKAAQQFVNYIKSLNNSNSTSSTTTTTTNNIINEVFSSLGFVALKQEAVETNSLIVVYLHSPLHRKADENILRLLLHPTILQFLNQDHIKTIGSSIYTSQGASLAQQLGVSSFPVLALLQPSNRTSNASSSASASGPAKLIFKAEGPSLLKLRPAQLLPLLNGTYQRFLSVVAENEARRIEREQEQLLRQQQDAEYQESLRADQERERQRLEQQQAEEERIRLEEEEQQRQIQEEKDRLERAKSLIQPEPAGGGARIRFVLPNGQKLDRRFSGSETIASLKAYLVVHFAEKLNNPDVKNIGLSTNFPKKTHDDDTKTLTESDLCPQSVLMVQDLDA